MSTAASDHRPRAAALPARLSPSGPGNMPGKMVRTVARHMADRSLASLSPSPGRLRGYGESLESRPPLVFGAMTAATDNAAGSAADGGRIVKSAWRASRGHAGSPFFE